MNVDIGTTVLLFVLLLLPAVLVFTVVTMKRVRRGKLHRRGPRTHE